MSALSPTPGAALRDEGFAVCASSYRCGRYGRQTSAAATQAALYTRHVVYGRELQAAVSAPRWLLGRTWGEATASLRIENRFSPEVVKALANASHDIELAGTLNEIMGHAGVLVRHSSGVIEGAADPRGDGVVAGF